MPILSPETILRTTNESTPLFSNLFGSQKNGFYDFFYNSFLTTPNSLPLNNLWIVFFNSIPTEILSKVTEYEGWGDSIKKSHEKAKEEGLRTTSGLLIAQSVKILGEKMDVQRVGSSKMGLVKGLVSDGRSPYQTFTVSMMENQLSFVDYVLRPWVIAASNASLKDPSFKTDIVVWHLGKMGPRRDLARRKIFIYKNCVPVSIDEQEYNYSGNDVLIKRTVDFAFSKYVMEEADEKFIKLVESGYKEKGLISNIIGGLKEDLTRALGANNLNQFVANTIDGLRTFAVETATTAIGNVGANTTGAVSDTVGGAINSVGGGLRGDVNEGVGGINDAVNETINNITRSENGRAPASFTNMNDDTPKFGNPNTLQIGGNVLGAKILKTNSDDATNNKIVSPPIALGKNPIIDTNKSINQLDTPTGITYSNLPTNGDINSDTVRFSDSLTYKKVSNPKNDYRVQYEQVSYIRKSIGDNDSRKNYQKVNYKQILNSENDVRRTGESVGVLDNKANEDDVPDKSTIKYTIKIIDQNDATNYKQGDKITVKELTL